MFALRPILISVSSLVLLAGLPACDAAPARSSSRSPQKVRYQHLKPFEDLSIQEDAADTYDRAVEAFSKQNYVEAEKLFSRVLELTPKNADAKYNLGAIAEWHNNLPKALSLYKEALALKPAERDFQKAVSDVQLKMQIDVEAKENKRQEGLVESGRRAKAAFAGGNYYEAAKQLEQLVKIFPNEAKVHFALGQSLRALKVFEWSAYHLKMAIYLEPTDETYRKALVELDQEILLAQEQAINDSAKMAISNIRPFSGAELAYILGGDLK